jgi:hypothetical protein
MRWNMSLHNYVHCKVPQTIPSHRWILFGVAYIYPLFVNEGFQLTGWRVSHFGKLGNHDERAACSNIGASSRVVLID